MLALLVTVLLGRGCCSWLLGKDPLRGLAGVLLGACQVGVRPGRIDA
jgi:hypothetical protein